MTAAEEPAATGTNTHGSASFLAAAVALGAMDDALRDARLGSPDMPGDPGPDPGPEQALAF